MLSERISVYVYDLALHIRVPEHPRYPDIRYDDSSRASNLSPHLIPMGFAMDASSRRAAVNWSQARSPPVIAQGTYRKTITAHDFGSDLDQLCLFYHKLISL